MGTDTDLQIINFSTRKHVDAGTLSRIRSHAQHYVQGQRGRGKGAKSSGVYGRYVSAPKGDIATFCSTISFEESKEQTQSRKARSPRGRDQRVKKTDPKTKLQPVNATPMLEQSPGAAFEPFDAFPVLLDSDFVYLFERYHKAWKWRQTKGELFAETVSNAALCHSWLAIANNMALNNEVKAIEHEIKTIDIVYDGLERLPNLSANHAQTEALSLTWAILRLAMIKANQGELDEVASHLKALDTIAPSKEVIENAKFGDHIQCTIAILLLVNAAQMDRMNLAMRDLYGGHQTSAPEDVEGHRCSLSSTSPLLRSFVAGLIDESILDSLKALTALCQSLPTSDTPQDYPTTYSKEQNQAIGCMRIGSRLANFTSAASLEGPTQWQDELQGCLSLSALIFIWCFGRRKEAVPTAISHIRDEVRQKLTPELICRAVHEVGRSQPLLDLMLWMLIVCGSAEEERNEKLYYSGLIRMLAPDFLEMSFENLESWGRVMPWIRGSSKSPVEEFWAFTTGRLTESGFDAICIGQPERRY